jgi:hypothetical protein
MEHLITPYLGSGISHGADIPKKAPGMAGTGCGKNSNKPGDKNADISHFLYLG